MFVGLVNFEKKNNYKILVNFDIRNLNFILWCIIEFIYYLMLFV